MLTLEQDSSLIYKEQCCSSLMKKSFHKLIQLCTTYFSYNILPATSQDIGDVETASNKLGVLVLTSNKVLLELLGLKSE